MTNLNELKVPEGSDNHTAWAIREEFALRREAWEATELVRREGVAGAFRRLAAVMLGEEETDE